MSATTIRAKDWIFNAIWAASGERGAPKCYITIPITFIFKNGKPIKALATDRNGVVERVSLESVEEERTDRERGFRGENFRTIRAFRKLLIQFSDTNRYGEYQYNEAEILICKVIYTDEQMENLSLKTLDTLLRNEAWRSQVLLVQGYIPSINERSGHYSNEPQVRSKLDSNETAAADNFSRAIAKYAEKAYVVSSSVLLNRAANDQETSVSLKVTQMKCLYALDPKDQLVFLYTEYVSVEIDSGRAEIEDYLSQEKAARESSAAKAISIEMQNLLLHAKQRGLSTDQSFLHFDTMGNGFIDADQLIDGLARLGIGVTYPVAEAVLQIIGGIGANFVTMADFEKFLVGPVDVEAFEKVHTKKVNKTKKNSKTTGRSVANVSKASRLEEMSRISSADTFETSRSVATGTKKVVKQLLPPIKDFQATQASMDFMDIKASQQHDWKKLDETVPKVEYMELPLPEKAYNTGSNLSKTSDGMDLPTWARQRSHRALNQLRKARTSSSLSSASLNLNILEPSSSVVPSRQSSPPKSRASSRGKGSAGSKKSKAVQPLTLQSVAQDIDKNGTISSQDEFLHVDHGVIMTYRLLQGVGDRVENIKTHEKTDSLRYNSILELREKNLNALSSQNESTSRGDIEESDIAEISQALESTAASIDGPSGIAEEKSNSPNSRGNSKKDKKLSFTVVVVPDLFMTLDTLQQHFDPLLLRYPHAKIVLVGLPGLPHTVWPREWILNPDLHSRSIAKLLQHLQTTEQINSDPYLFEPVFFIGIGTSANCLSRFMCLFLPKLQAVEAQTRGICIVNGVLRFTKKFKKLCKDLRQSMLSSTPFEINELITSLHFWDEYLAVNGRDLCLDKFWSTRRSLRAINNSTEADHIFAAGNALGYFGILEQLKGILISPDDFDGALMLQSTDIPVIVVQSTEDVFVDPKTANMFQAESLPPERILVTDVHDSLDTNAVFINWLRAGHEVLQERNTFMLGLISNLAQMCGFQPIRETVIERVKAEKEAEEKALQQKAELEMFDVLDLASRRKQEQKRATEGKIEQERLEEEERQALLLQQEENEFITRKTLIAEEEAQMIARAREQEEATRKDEKDRLAAAESKAEAEEQRLEKERKSVEARKAAELSKRNQMVADRRKRELQATINAERQVFYQREQEEKDRKRELQEVIKMRKEDARSKFAADYQIECEIAEISAKLSKIKAQELERHRREEAIKVNEERKARERALRIEDRRRKAEEVIKQMEATELILAGMMEGGYDLPNDPPMHVIEVIDSTHRLMQDLMECRQKSVEAMKRQFMIFDKTVTFRKQVATLENEERRLRRAIRLVEINPAIVGDDLSAAAELDDLQRLLGEKQDALTELMSLANLKEGQLNAANRCVQQLKKISGERDSLMVQRLQDMLNIENVLSNRLKELKMKKESLIVQKDRQRIALIVSQKRVDQLNKEIIRVEGHSGEVIDTDVWVEGVLQRCRTLELKNHLANEMQMAEKKVQGIIEALDSIRHNIFDVTEIIAKIKRDSDKISSVYKLFYRTYHKFSAVPLSTIMKNLQQLQDKAEKIELRKAKEDDINKMFALAGSTSLVDKVRLKDSDIRTKDERQFVGIDLIMNPHAYIHLSPVEREQMHFDKDYHCTLAKADLDRILKLPEQINLALPFLHTEVEVNAHRLLNQFLRGKDEQFFKNRDYISEQGILAALREDSGEGLTDIDGNIMVIEEKDVQISEITHDILVRESLRDRVRSLGVDDKMTAEEFQWLQVDRILAPHMFTGEEVSTASEAPARNVEKSLVTNFTKKKLISRLMGKTTVVNEEHGNAAAKEGGIYDPIRQKFAEGEDVFLRTWSCPFTKAELNAIRCKPLHTLQGNDEVLVRKLMDKYYVDDNESTLGHNRLKILGKLANKMSKTVQMIDADSVENAINRKATFDEEELTFDRLTSMSNDPNKFMNHVMDTNIKRIWGSWEQVHPASAGKESQNSYFMLSTFDAARDHPAYYAVHDEQDDYLSDDDAVHELVNRNKLKSESIEAIQKDPAELEKEGLRVLTGNGDPPPVKNKGLDTNKNDPNSKFFITESITDLAQQDPRKVRGKIILLQNKEPMLLLQEKECKLPTRQSKSYYFTIPDRESTRILDITVSIIFQGEFGNNGYKLGRLAAALFRLPESKSSADTSMPIPVGFSPYALQCPNLSDKMGKVVITHKPKLRPIKPGSYQVVIGTAAATKFSIEVSCKYAQTALPLVDEAIQTAKQLQMRLPQCLAEISGVVESLRLTERKLLICDKLITEAEAETDRCQFAMQSIMAKLDRDDDEMTLMEEERRDLQRELNILEMEYTQWAGIYGSRNKEKDVIQEGIAMMYKFQKDRNEEKMKIKKDLEQYRRDLPPCIFILRTMVEATNVAAALNTTVQGVSDEAGAAATGDFGGIQVSTPADDIRRQLKQYGFSSLLLEEQQWCLLDQALNPHKYEWLREQEEREAAEREAVGKKPKETKFNPALEQYRMSKVEIEYVLETPFSMLNRREVLVRKLLTKYHDDKEHMKKAISAVAYSFDPHLAERTRSKHPKQHSKEDKEWISVDKILHPEVWKYYVNEQRNWLDRNAKDTLIGGSDGRSSRRSKKKNNKSKDFTTFGMNMASRTSDSINESESVDNTMGLPSLDSISHDDHSKSVERSLMTNSAEYDHLVASGAIGAMHHLKRLEREKKISKRPEWHCPFDKTGLLRVWRTPRHHLKTDDERHAFRLIQKYNGSYSSYMDTVRQSQRRQQRAVKDGSHIQWEKLGKVVSKDMDYRARQLLREIDRATFTKNEYIHSDVLHANDQRFPTNVLRVQLEDTLDNLLSDQIKERERAEKMRVTDSDSESDDDLPMIGEDAELSMDDSGTEENGNIMEKIKKRAKKRQQLRRRMKEKEETLQDEVMKARKIVKGNKGKSGVELAEAILRSQLGVNGCLACRVKRCKWQPCVDIEICTNRINLLDRELERVRLDRDAAVFESDICLSAQLGGNRIFKRHDLVDELVSEKREIERRFDLNNVDKELHDSYNCRTEYFESRFLHGYAMMMWTNNARKALEARQNRLVALSVAKEAVDGILDWMLEGWYFGERESQFSVLGYVPSIKPSGKVAAGLDQVTAMTTVVSKMKERANNKRKGIETDQTRRGVIMEKAWQVEQNAQKEYKSKKVARDGNEHEHLLNETESTLKFGIFMLTLMYFRAMALVKREQRSWNAEDEEFAVPGKGKQLKKMTDERMRMLDEESKAAARKKKIDLILARSKVGEQRRREREAMERREAIIRLHQLVSQQKKELYAVTKIQKIYRGHLGRKAAKRWALKRAELGAMTALLNSTAIAIQRVYRGYVARELAVIKRTEMAQFIALMRVQEAEADEDIYWQTHPWTRFKRDKKEWLAKKLLQRKKQNVLGGARLTEEEQALLEGKTIAEIRAQVNEFKEEDEDELPAGLRRSVRESAKSRRSSVSSVFTMSSRRSSLDDNESERIGVSTSESQR